MDETSFQALELDLHSTTFRRDQWHVSRAMTVQGNREAVMPSTIARTQPQSLNAVLFVGRGSSASALAVSSRLHKKRQGIFYVHPSQAEGTLFHLKAALCWAVLKTQGDSSALVGELTHRLLAGAVQFCAAACPLPGQARYSVSRRAEGETSAGTSALIFHLLSGFRWCLWASPRPIRASSRVSSCLVSAQTLKRALQPTS